MGSSGITKITKTLSSLVIIKKYFLLIILNCQLQKLILQNIYQKSESLKYLSHEKSF